MSPYFQDLRLACALHTAELYGSARSLLGHIEQVGPWFREVHSFLSAHGPLETELQKQGVICHVWPFIHHGLRKRKFRNITWRNLKEVLGSRYVFVRRMRDELRSHPCLVHVHSSVCVYAMYAAVQARAPLVVHVRETRKPTIECWLREQCMLRWAHGIVTVSEGIKRGYSRALQQRAITIYNWIEVPQRTIERPADGRIIGFVGSIHFEKGIREFLEMCARLKAKGEQFEAHIYGEALNSEIEQWCSSYESLNQLSSNVRWWGMRQNAEEIYPNIDIFVLPTYHDALPRSVMEAMAWGIPVVASGVGGIPEMVGHEAGYLIPPRDVSSLTSVVSKLLRDPSLRREMGRAGRERARRLFSPERYRNEMLQLYRDVLTEWDQRNGFRKPSTRP